MNHEDALDILDKVSVKFETLPVLTKLRIIKLGLELVDEISDDVTQPALGEQLRPWTERQVNRIKRLGGVT